MCDQSRPSLKYYFTFYRPQTKFAKVMWCFYTCLSVNRRGHAWQGACMVGGGYGRGGHVWQGCECGRGHVWQGACMAEEGMHGGEGVCMVAGVCVWQGACVAGGMHGRGGHAWWGGGVHGGRGVCVACTPLADTMSYGQ